MPRLTAPAAKLHQAAIRKIAARAAGAAHTRGEEGRLSYKIAAAMASRISMRGISFLAAHGGCAHLWRRIAENQHI